MFSTLKKWNRRVATLLFITATGVHATSPAIPPPFAFENRVCASSHIVIATARKETLEWRSVCTSQVAYFDQEWCQEATVELEIKETVYPQNWSLPQPFRLTYYPLRTSFDDSALIFFIAEIRSPRGNTFQLQGQMDRLHPISPEFLQNVHKALATCTK